MEEWWWWCKPNQPHVLLEGGLGGAVELLDREVAESQFHLDFERAVVDVVAA